jgi:UbiD family decarboxylase
MTQTSNPLDLRIWLDHIQEFGELEICHGASVDLEIGAISQLNVKKQQHSALLFEDIIDYPKGFRVLTCSTGSKNRLASILRLPQPDSHQTLIESLKDKPLQWQAISHQFPPLYIKRGPILENIQIGKDVDLHQFPAVLWNQNDGGRYIGTGCSIVTKDLESEWVNVGTYRVMLHDKNRVGLMMIPGKHGHIQQAKYIEAKKPFPVVIILGADPLSYLISGIEVPYELSEYNYMGAILGEPVSVIKGDVTGLPFPSAAEIVLEGWVYPNDKLPEGPFGEFLGYYTSDTSMASVVTVEKVYFRNQPIILGSPPSKPPNDYSYSKSVMRSALLFNSIIASGVPNVKSVWAHEIGGSRMFNVISIQQKYAGHSRQAGHILSQCGVGAYMSRYSIVVDEDIDPANLQEVMWAIATRSDPVKDIDFIQRGMGSQSDPLSIANDSKAPFASKAIIDACRPYEYLQQFPKVVDVSKDLENIVKKKWPKLF